MLYTCELCDYSTSNKTNFTKHKTTRKHKMVTNGDKKVAKIYECEFCDKKYKHRQGLNRHVNKCHFVEKPKLPVMKPEKTDTIEKTTHDNSNHININISDNKNENIEEKIAENAKEMNTVIKVLIDENKKLTDTIQDMIPKIGTTNTTNNNFNLNLFLNETCKDAINISEFIETITVGMDDLRFTHNNGIIEGVTTLLIDGLGKLEVNKRPIHCTDTKRKTLYIKDDNTWERNNKDTVKKTINEVQNKHMIALEEWKIAHPNWLEDPKLADEYLKLVKESSMSLQEKNENRIINRVSKEVEITKEFEVSDNTKK